MHRLEEIGAAASKEFSLEKALDKMMAEWKGMCFTFVPYRDTVCVCVCVCVLLTVAVQSPWLIVS